MRCYASIPTAIAHGLYNACCDHGMIMPWIVGGLSLLVAIGLVEAFLEEQVKSGACQNPSDLVNDALRGIREQQHKSFEVTPELEAWLLEAADTPTSPLTGTDFDSVRERVRARTKSAAS